MTVSRATTIAQRGLGQIDKLSSITQSKQGVVMEFSGEYRIPARQKRVWDALSDPALLQACIAGCNRVEKISDSEMVATVVVTVGPISATFKGDVALSSLSAPIGFTLTGHDGDSALARIEAQVSLAEDQDDTLLKYVATAEISGQLASVGGWMAQTVARMNADEFFAAFARQLSTHQALTNTLPVAPLSTEASRSTIVLAPTAADTLFVGSHDSPASRWPTGFAAGLGVILGYGLARWI